jgi:hypothetical protein
MTRKRQSRSHVHTVCPHRNWALICVILIDSTKPRLLALTSRLGRGIRGVPSSGATSHAIARVYCPATLLTVITTPAPHAPRVCPRDHAGPSRSCRTFSSPTNRDSFSVKLLPTAQPWTRAAKKPSFSSRPSGPTRGTATRRALRADTSVRQRSVHRAARREALAELFHDDGIYFDTTVGTLLARERARERTHCTRTRFTPAQATYRDP